MPRKSTRNRYAGKGTNKRASSNLKTGRDYTYDKQYQSSSEQKANRAKRNSARKSAIKDGRVSVGSKKDVHHVKPLRKGGSNKKSNTRVISRKTNRGKKR
tara:strand:+ start:3431 stop:3730 length:300 start_codon:yes stop_codon:yes gene_type:complete